MTDDELHQLLGAYLLGGLDSADRERFARHLAACEACRDELARSAALPSLLRRAEGLWEPADTLAIARELDLRTIIPAFDGTGRPLKAGAGRVERRWLRVDGAGPTTRLRAALAESLAVAVEDSGGDAGVVILFAGPRGYANLRAYAAQAGELGFGGEDAADSV